jgi:hypothetical protein
LRNVPAIWRPYPIRLGPNQSDRRQSPLGRMLRWSHRSVVARPGNPWLTSFVALLPCVLGVLIGMQFLTWMAAPTVGIGPFPDANTYRAAGERLAAGHDLYYLGPGDRDVLHVVGTSDAALLSPPPIAVLWRFLVVIPFGFEAWLIGCWVSLLGTTFLLARRTGLKGALLASILAPAIGEQLAAGNMASFFPGLRAIGWATRSRWMSGVVVGAMAGLKIAPGSMSGWVLGTRNWRALVGVVGAIGIWIMLSVIGAGTAALPEYAEMLARGVGPSWLSLSGLAGIGWLSPAVLIAGTVLAATLGRWPALSFSVGVFAAVLGTPALYLSGLVTLLAVLAPIGWPPSADAARRRRSAA